MLSLPTGSIEEVLSDGTRSAAWRSKPDSLSSFTSSSGRFCLGHDHQNVPLRSSDREARFATLPDKKKRERCAWRGRSGPLIPFF